MTRRTRTPIILGNWVETPRGFVNLNFVETVERRAEGKDSVLVLRTKDATFVTAPVPGGFSLEEALRLVVPGSGHAVILHPEADTDGARPTNVWVEHQPIIGWRLPGYVDGAAWPVLIDFNTGTQRAWWFNPDGSLTDGFSGTFNSLEHLKAHVLAEEQAEWDRENAEKAA